MSYISLKSFSPIISDKIAGGRIYDLIMSKDPINNEVIIDMGDIKSMATFCAQQIFGRLYKELTPKVFYKNIKIKNASDDIILLIKLGISYATRNEMF